MKIIILKGRVIELETERGVGVEEVFRWIADVYRMWPTVSIYLDVGAGAAFIPRSICWSGKAHEPLALSPTLCHMREAPSPENH